MQVKRVKNYKWSQFCGINRTIGNKTTQKFDIYQICKKHHLKNPRVNSVIFDLTLFARITKDSSQLHEILEMLSLKENEYFYLLKE